MTALHRLVQAGHGPLWLALATGLAAAGGCAIDDRTLTAAPVAGAGGTGPAGQGGEGPGGPGGQGGEGASAGSAGISGGSGQGGAGKGGGSGGISGASGQSGSTAQDCLTATECDDQNPCTADDCQNTACVHISSNALVPPQVKGNCQREVCTSGKVTGEPDTTDLPVDDSKPCQTDECSAAGEAVHMPITGGGCQVGENSGTCKAGFCEVGCQDDGQCDDKSSCTDDTCVSGTCQFAKKADNSPTPGATDTPGDCQTSVCLDGTPTPVADPMDVPAPATCTQGVCTDTMPSQSVVPNGTDCSQVGGPGFLCVSGVCQAPSCGDGIRNGADACDKNDLGGQTCLTLGLPDGTLLCGSDCSFDTGQCGSVCGDGKVGPGEQCDDLNNKPGDGCSAYCTTEPTAGALVITEVMINPNYNDEADIKEWFELYNTSTTTTYDLRGLRIRSNSGSNVGAESAVINSGTTPLPVAPQSYVVLGRAGQALKSDGVPVLYAYGSSNQGYVAFANGSDALSIEVIDGPQIDRVSWVLDTSSTTYRGATFSLDPTKTTAALNDTFSNWCPSKTQITASNLDRGTPGKANDSCP